MYLGPTGWHADPRTGLYEFALDDGRPVRLHDTYLRVVQLEGRPADKLVLVFEYDRTRIPEGLEATPVVEFRFSGVRNLVSEQESNSDDVAEDVQLFDHIPPDHFCLQTMRHSLHFTAAAVELLLR